MVKYQKSGISTEDKKAYHRIYKRKYQKYVLCDICGSKTTNMHGARHTKMKKHIRASKYIEQNKDFDVPLFEPIDMQYFYWKE